MAHDEFEVYIENAIRWAKAQLGATGYSTRCLSFVEDAYEQSNRVEIFGGSSAKESADEYEASKNTSTPPAGAFVFYDCHGTLFETYKNWGHVGLAVGDGTVVHALAQVRVDPYMQVENIPPSSGWTEFKYIGWAPVERIFRGYRKKG